MVKVLFQKYLGNVEKTPVVAASSAEVVGIDRSFISIGPRYSLLAVMGLRLRHHGQGSFDMVSLFLRKFATDKAFFPTLRHILPPSH